MKRILAAALLVSAVAFSGDAKPVAENTSLTVNSKTGECSVVVTLDLAKCSHLSPGEKNSVQRRILMRAVEMLRDSIEALARGDAAEVDKRAEDAAAKVKAEATRLKAALPSVKIKD